MNLTLYDLETVKKACNNLSKLIDDIKTTYNPDRDERKLFVSRQDYFECQKKKNTIPQDFYFFRAFDVFIQVCYNKNLKKYTLYCDGFYSDILNKFERYQRSTKSYIISDCFEEALLIFQDVVNDCMQDKFVRNGLF